MKQRPNKLTYKEVLDELQLQSWQLELVISGFAIFGLFSSLEPLFDMFQNQKLLENNFGSILFFALYFSCLLTIINLIIHVLLRALWIGAVGIRSISGDIDYDRLDYGTYFSNYLKKKIGSFDDYILRLENYSSLIFGLAFIIVFITISFFLNFAFLIFLLSEIFDPVETNWIMSLFLFLFTVGHLINISDTFTQGFWKKKFPRFFIPIYKIYSLLSFSFFYRPILYNLLDNKPGKKLILWLLPVYTVSIFVFSMSYISTNYFSGYFESSNNFASRRNYWDLINDTGDHIGLAAIPSKVITTHYLEISIDYQPYLENTVFKYDSTFIPKTSKIGYTNFFKATFGWSLSHESQLPDKSRFLNTINQMFITKIDSTNYSENFIVSKNKKGSSYLKKYIDISKLEKGKHILHIQHYETKDDSLKIIKYETIPFWYFKD